MSRILASLLLITQLMNLSAPAPRRSDPPVQQERLWWGLIDPELSLWFSRLPVEPADHNILWDFSWRGFLAALFGQPSLMEEVADAPHA